MTEGAAPPRAALPTVTETGGGDRFTNGAGARAPVGCVSPTSITVAVVFSLISVQDVSVENTAIVHISIADIVGVTTCTAEEHYDRSLDPSLCVLHGVLYTTLMLFALDEVVFTSSMCPKSVLLDVSMPR